MIISWSLRSENKTPLNFDGKNVLNLNGTWDFKYLPSSTIGDDSLFYTNSFDASGWANIQVPGQWELQGFAEPSYGRALKEGTGLYRRSFRLSPYFQDKQIFIQFNGVLYGYDIFINGRYVGSWASSFNAASFNITKYVNFSGENLLAVRVSTHSRGFEFDISDGWALSGIFRDASIFGTPETYLYDHTVRTKVNANARATVDVSVELGGTMNQNKGRYQLKAELISPTKKLKSKTKKIQGLSGYSFHFEIKSPALWTAETPNLYNLKLSLIQDGQIIQEKNQTVGIREITIDKTVMKLNGSPLKLRGVDHHDIVPETGRTMSREQILKDLTLMKRANINFIRTSHYPPNHRLLDLCDSLGIYVDCEVPFNFGRNLLTDTTYQDILIRRAKATLFRDKNHPCIVFWSVGNENPSTKITDSTGRYVQKNDPTRPMCFAGLLLKSKRHPDIQRGEPDFVDISSSHYKYAEWIREKSKTATKSCILTEYAHALGTAFGNMEDTWKEMFRADYMAGGAVWMFQDQGIYRKAKHPVDIHKPTDYVWADSVNYYDTEDQRGVDGIVYSDRIPQVDYWQVRKVYSPIQIIDSKLPVVPGKQELKFQVYNQYDFLNLNVLKGEWQLLKNRRIIKSGKLDVNCAPHDTVLQEMSLVLPESLENDAWLLRFEFQDKKEMPVYEHAIRLLPKQGLELVKSEIHLPDNPLEIDGKKVTTGNFCFSFFPKNFSVRLTNQANKKELITGGLYARVGRLQTINDKTVQENSPEAGDYPWSPHLLEAADVEHVTENRTNKAYSLSGTVKFLKGEKYPGQFIEGNISCKVERDGIFTVNYDLTPKNATGILLEAGISFRLSKEISDFIWLGDGPFASTPDKHLLNDFGVHYLKKGDLNFNGNRANVEVAVLTDVAGNGIAIIGDNSNISVELIDGQIIVNHDALVSGNGNKKSIAQPAYRVDASQIKQMKGMIKIMPLHANYWPKKLIEIVGLPDKSKKAYAPFYYGYDWSK